MSEVFQRANLQLCAPVLALISGVGSAIAYWGQRGSLWEDEIIAITHGLQPFPEFFIEVLRTDIHPFFYFLLLKGWASLNIGSDAWALASSLVSAALSAGIVACITSQVHGRRAGLWAAALFCVLPTFAWAAGNLRMYGLAPGIAIACWFANRELLRTGRAGWAGGLVMLQLMQAYVHAIGFFFAAFFALAAFLEQWQQADRRRLLIWGTTQAASLIAMVPVVISALIRGTEPLSSPGLFSAAIYPAQTMSVWGAGIVALAVGGMTFVVLLSFALLDKASRIPILLIPCGVLLACIVVSSMGKPMFKPPVFTANLAPFLAMGAAAGISKSQRAEVRIAAVAYTVFMAVVLWLWPLNKQMEENYQPAARYIVANAEPGDVVVVPNVSVFWGLMRYAVAPQWGLPLAILPLQSNEQWTKLKATLGRRWVERLSLTPVADHVISKGVRYVIGTSAEHHSKETPQVWVVHRHYYSETVRLAVPMRLQSVTWFGDELSVSLIRRDETGSKSFSNPRR